MTDAAAVIPARYASVRFPGKVLADRTGKPLIEHVYEQVRRAELVERVTGSPLSHDALLRHLRGKLGSLYGVI